MQQLNPNDADAFSFLTCELRKAKNTVALASMGTGLLKALAKCPGVDIQPMPGNTVLPSDHPLVVMGAVLADPDEKMLVTGFYRLRIVPDRTLPEFGLVLVEWPDGMLDLLQTNGAKMLPGFEGVRLEKNGFAV